MPEKKICIIYRLLPMIHLLFAEANPDPLKAASANLGLIDDELHEPMQRASDQVASKLIAAMKGP